MLGVRIFEIHRVLAPAALAAFAVCWVVHSADAQPFSGGISPFASRPTARPTAYPTTRPDPSVRPDTASPSVDATLTGPVTELRIVGNETVKTSKVRSYLKTRIGRSFDPYVVQSDVRKLVSTGLFADVRTYTQPSSRGIVVTFEVFERPTIRYVKFIGNGGIRESVLLKESELKVDEALNYYTVSEARRKVETFYRSKGFTSAHVTIKEGDKPRDRGVVLMINEGVKAKILYTRFVGNTIASDSRLKTQIQSKPGFAYLFKGEVDRTKIDEDVERITSYYRGLGYFRARVGRELEFSSSGKWGTLTFVIDEGPQYVVRNVSFVGYEKMELGDLSDQVKLKEGDNFHLAKMNRDIATIRDLYGSQGYVYADVKVDPRFLEEPGQLDLVYAIREGEQFRVGKIGVEIRGDNPHTRHSVVLNRRGTLQPGDIIDIREIRKWERRLKSSQLFENNPAQGIAPHVAIRTPTLEEAASLADKPVAPPSRTIHPGPGSSSRGPSSTARSVGHTTGRRW